MPILGILASSRPAIAADTGAMFPLQVVTVGGAGASSITFSNIPNTYEHLQIRGITRSSRNNINSNNYIGFNNDTTTGNYYSHYLNGDGSNAASGGKIGTSTNALLISVGATAATGVFNAFVIDILDYANTNKYKTTRSLNGYENNASSQGLINLQSGLWMNTNAITSIQITDPLGSFVQYSQFALYGVKGAA